MKKTYKIKEVSQIVGIEDYNLRFYENQGFHNLQRGDNNYREYSLDSIFSLNTLNYLLSLGYPIKEAMEYLNPHSASEICESLSRLESQLEQERFMLQKKQEAVAWLQKLYSSAADGEKRYLIRENQEFLFLEGTETEDPGISLGSSQAIREWVQASPAISYACLFDLDREEWWNEYSLGFLGTGEDVFYLGLPTDRAREIHMEYCVTFMMAGPMDNLWDYKKDPALQMFLDRQGFRIGETTIHRYGMFENEDHAKDYVEVMLEIRKKEQGYK